GGDERLGLARFGTFVDVEHGVVHHLVDLGLDEHRLLPTVTGRPDPTLLGGGGGRGRERLGGSGHRGRLQRLVGAGAFVGFAALAGKLCHAGRAGGLFAAIELATATVVRGGPGSRCDLPFRLRRRLIEQPQRQGGRRRRLARSWLQTQRRALLV